MSEVIVGGNGFRDCKTIIAFGGRPLLGLKPGSNDVQLHVPALGAPNAEKMALVFEGYRVVSGDDGVTRQLTIRHHDDEVRVYFAHSLLLVVSQLSDLVIHIHLDLRPLGVRVFSDAEGLHVGPHTFFNLAFQAESPAISVSTDGIAKPV